MAILHDKGRKISRGLRDLKKKFGIAIEKVLRTLRPYGVIYQ